MTSSKNYKFLFPIITALILILGIQLGIKIAEYGNEKPSFFSTHEFDIWDEILNVIDAKYIEGVDRNTLKEKTIREMIGNLDPHSFYISQQDIKQINESLSGNFEGIGVEFQILNDTIQVITPITGGPSEALGIQAGDKIVYIEDSLVAGTGITNRVVMEKLRGERNTNVQIKIYRPGFTDLLTFDITRDKIPINSIESSYMVDNETGYIKLSRFSANTYEEFAGALNNLVMSGMQRLIVDVRQNPGGYLTAATKIAEEFIEPRRLLVYTEGRTYRRNNYMSRSIGQFENGPLVILIDEGSASASEILAGAVQDWDRGLIIGRKSFGKGSVQEQYTLSDGSALRLTIAKYYTPSGRSIQKPFKKMAEENIFSENSEDTLQVVDQQVFYTSANRVVYGGGGITPDFLVERDTSFNLQLFARIRNEIPSFIYTNYTTKVKTEVDAYTEFNSFLSNYTVSDKLFNELMERASAKNNKFKENEISEIEDRLKVWMKAYIARQKFGREYFYPVINTTDEIFLRALEEINDLPPSGSILDVQFESLN
ncbi:MAG: S41 family peptidase [Chitinophagaceae bacterium]|nr:MAG: S41 family peptidase [Chitinophagaceae bacterium]